MRLHRPLVLHLRELPGEELTLGDLRDHPGEALLNELVRRDRPVAPLLARFRVVQGGLVGGHGAAEGAPGDPVAGLCQARQRPFQTLDSRENAFRPDPAVLERELRRDRRAQRHLSLVLERREPGVPALDEKPTDHAVQLGPDDRDVRDRPVRNPGFRSVQHEAVPVFSRRGPHARRVGAEVRLRQTEASDRRGGRELRDPAVLLFGRAEGVDRVHHERGLHRDERAQAGISALELLHDQTVGDVVEAGQTVVRERRAEEVHFRHLRNELGGELSLPGGLLDDRQDPVLDPAADGVADEPLLLGQEGVEAQVVHSFAWHFRARNAISWRGRRAAVGVLIAYRA